MRTEFLDLPVWDDTEIADALGETPLTREKLHHWPLSYVERVDFSNKSVVIKYSKLSMENEFYTSASAPFLVKTEYMTSIGDTSVTVLPLVVGREPDDGELAAASALIRQISSVPLWLDASTHEKYMEMISESCRILNKFDPDFRCDEYLGICRGMENFFTDDKIGLVHGDLKRDNVLVAERGIIILDWQRPMIAPYVIDSVTCGLLSDKSAVALAKSFETYWLLYAFDRCLHVLPHVLNWAKKNISDIIA